MYPSSWKFAEEAYRDATERPFGYLFVDLNRTRTNDVAWEQTFGLFILAPILDDEHRLKIRMWHTAFADTVFDIVNSSTYIFYDGVINKRRNIFTRVVYNTSISCLFLDKCQTCHTFILLPIFPGEMQYVYVRK